MSTTYRMEPSDELKHVHPAVLAIHQYQETKNGYVIIIYNIGDPRDTTIHEYENHYYYVFTNIEIQQMLNTLLQDMPTYEANGWSVAAYKFISDLDGIYVNAIDKDKCMSMRMFNFTADLLSMVINAKGIKDLM